MGLDGSLVACKAGEAQIEIVSWRKCFVLHNWLVTHLIEQADPLIVDEHDCGDYPIYRLSENDMNILQTFVRNKRFIEDYSYYDDPEAAVRRDIIYIKIAQYLYREEGYEIRYYSSM